MRVRRTGRRKACRPLRSSIAPAKCDPEKARRSQRLLLGVGFQKDGAFSRRMWMQKRGAVGVPLSGVDRQGAGPLQLPPGQIACEQFATVVDRAIRLEPEDPCRLGLAADLTEARERRGFGLGQVEPA